MAIVYKVVQKLGDGALASYNLSKFEKLGKDCLAPYQVIYVPGKRVFPRVKGTPLWAYRSVVAAAGDYFWEASNLQLWNCRAVSPRAFFRPPRVSMMGVWSSFDNDLVWLKEVWKDWQKLAPAYRSENSQIVLCPSIKLIERVK